MPVTSAQLTPTILSQLNARGVVGPFAANLSAGIALGTEGFIQSLVVQSQATGALGVGVGTGKWFLEPTSGSTTLAAQMAGSGLVGTHQTQIATGLAFGISIVVNSSALVQTAVPTVAVGAGVGTITNANGALATQLLYAGLVANGITGNRASTLASAVGQGLAIWFRTGTITTAIAGTPVVPPVTGAGIGIGRIV